jgi:hypothetical protein
MIHAKPKQKTLAAIAFTLALTLVLTPAPLTDAADHRDGPKITDINTTLDIADLYLFLDPGDNSRAVIALTTTGFIVPGENSSAGIFDSTSRYLIEIENTGDAQPDQTYQVFFQAGLALNGVPQPQVATIILPNGRRFTAPATKPDSTSPNPPAPVVTTDSASGIKVFAGLVEDPFVSDVPAIARYVASIRNGAPDPTLLQRGRDTFAGYNMTGIALSIPVSLLRGSAGNEIGVSAATQRRWMQFYDPQANEFIGIGPWVNVDRIGVPSINVMLIPFNRKDAYNAANTTDDAAGKFRSDIIATLRALGTDDFSISRFLALAVNRGDILRLNTSIPNDRIGPTNPDESAGDDGRGFPNGRRYGDDVVDTELSLINNRQPLSDNANRNEVPFSRTFPYFGLSHQPFPAGTLDDKTRN